MREPPDIENERERFTPERAVGGVRGVLMRVPPDVENKREGFTPERAVGGFGGC